MPDLTPVKIRGKKSGTKEEKWHYGKKRTFAKSTPLTNSHSTAVADDSHAEQPSRKRRRRRRVELSRLEQFPTEILQSIFVFSANVDLPLASPHLSSQLANPHLYHTLCDAVLASALEDTSLSTEKRDATIGRLMNSKFFTYSFFRTWMEFRAQKSRTTNAQNEETRNLQLNPSHHVDFPETWGDITETWSDITGAYKFVLPPVKLFSSPLTKKKLLFLMTMVPVDRHDSDRDIPEWYLAHASRGLEAAIAAGNYLVLEVYWILGLRPSTEHLQQAVIDAACNKNVVRELVRRDAFSSPGLAGRKIDLLDPAVWSWAEKAESEGNDKGAWLRELLQEFSRKPAKSDAESRSIWLSVLGKL